MATDFLTAGFGLTTGVLIALATGVFTVFGAGFKGFFATFFGEGLVG